MLVRRKVSRETERTFLEMDKNKEHRRNKPSRAHVCLFP